MKRFPTSEALERVLLPSEFAGDSRMMVSMFEAPALAASKK